MKNKELQVTFKKIIDNLHVVFDRTINGATAYINIKGLKKFRIAVTILEKTAFYSDDIKEIKNTAVYTTADDSIVIKEQEGVKIQQLIENLNKSINSFYIALSSMMKNIPSNSISIKLSGVTDFSDLSKAASAFDKILSQSILNSEINGDVKIENVENGSIWLDVYLGSSAAVSLIGSMAWSSAVIYKKIQEGRIIEEHVKSLKIKNESLAEIKNAQKEAIELMIDAEANNLYIENFKNNDPEQIERLKHSIKLMSDQIVKGAEIHPGLNMPENVRNLFPDYKKLELVESKIKKLEA